MMLGSLAAKNVLGRNRVRTLLTIAAVAVTIFVFILLRTFITAWTAGAEHAAQDRIATRHKVSFVIALPKSYADKIQMNKDSLGVTDVTWCNWFGGKHPQRESDFFATIAVDPQSFLRVYDEIQLSPEERESWVQNRRGAVIGDALAKKFDWKVGDSITLEGTIYPGNWEFEISGIYTAARRSVDRSTLWFHWNYINESVGQRAKDQIGWLVSRVEEASRTAEVSKNIDAMFEDRGEQTTSMSERALQTSFLGMVSAILTTINVISVVILAIMMLILGNTIAMAVRERTNEYGMMRAIGFAPRHIATMVVGEALTIGLLGGLLALVLAYPMIEQGMGRFLEETMGGFFPYFRISGSTVIAALVLATALGALAAAIPAIRAARLNVVDALRRVG